MAMKGLETFLERLKQRHPEIAEYEKLTPKERLEQNIKSYNEIEGDRHLQDGYNCEICRNKGIICVVRSREYRGNVIYDECMTECKCTKIRSSILRMKRSGLEDLLKERRFDNYEVKAPWMQTIKEQAMNFAKNPAPLFFIGGQSGCGKTHLCTAIARQFLFEGKELRYMIWRDESTKLKSAINDEEKYQSLIEGFKRVDVLYIDDLFKVDDENRKKGIKPTGADLALALEIINNRYNAKLTTIISSEWTIRDIIGMDEALGGRIYEMAGKENCANIKEDIKKNYRLRDIVEL